MRSSLPATTGKCSNELGTLQRGQQRNRRAVAVADEIRRPTHDLLEEGDRVLRHLLVGDRAVDIRRAPVPAPVRPVDAEALRQRRDVPLEHAGVGQSRMQEHQRRARAVLLVVGAHVAELNIAGQCFSYRRRSRVAARGAV
jgi:hypothetical protein